MAEIQDLSTTDASNTGAAANAGFPENMNPSDVNNAARALEGMIARLYADTNGSIITTGSSNAYVLAAARTIASYAQGQVFMFEANHANSGASTLNVDSVGAKAIVKHDDVALASGDIKAGQICFVAYEATGDNFQMLSPPSGPVGVAQGGTGVSTLTDGHILIGTGSTITSGAFFSSSTGTLLGTKGGTIGQQTIWVPAAAMEPAVTTAPAVSNAVEIGTSLFAARTMDFADGSDLYCYFGIQMPKSWDGGNLVLQFVWSATGTNANTVAWGASAISLGNDEALTTAFGDPTVATADTNSTTADDLMISAELTLTVGSSPAAENYVMFEIMRDVSADTLAEPARLHGIRVHYTVSTGIDS
jgi:hypothetical protein